MAKIKAIEATYRQTVKPPDNELMAHLIATRKAIAEGNQVKPDASKKNALLVFTRPKIARKALGIEPAGKGLPMCMF